MGLYRGVTAQSLNMGVIQATRFPVHASTKSFLNRYVQEGSGFVDLIAGGVAGAASVLAS